MDHQELQKIIECCHLNFLIGSGASRPFLGTLGTIEQLLTSLAEDKAITDDDRLIIDASIKKRYFEVAIRGNLELDKTDSYLEQTKSNYRSFYTTINTILLKRQTNLISRQANVFTSNMDLFHEQTFERCGITYNDGFSGRLSPVFRTENFNNSIRKTSLHFEYQSEVPSFNLFKIHGSVNWNMQSNGEIHYDNNLEILSDVKNCALDKKDLIDIEYEIPGFPGAWLNYTTAELQDQVKSRNIKKNISHIKFIEAYDKLAMINPTKDKFESTTTKLNFYELLRMYSNTLEKENSVLITFGFSFADEHIREITLRVSKANPTLLIIIFAFDESAKASIELLLPSRNNIKILSPSSSAVKYSFDVINSKYFEPILNDLLY